MDVSPPLARVVTGREERRQFRPPQRLATRVFPRFQAISWQPPHARARHRGFCFDVTDWAGARDVSAGSVQKWRALEPRAAGRARIGVPSTGRPSVGTRIS